jgi:hypothetical protein
LLEKRRDAAHNDGTIITLATPLSVITLASAFDIRNKGVNCYLDLNTLFLAFLLRKLFL